MEQGILFDETAGKGTEVTREAVPSNTTVDDAGDTDTETQVAKEEEAVFAKYGVEAEDIETFLETVEEWQKAKEEVQGRFKCGGFADWTRGALINGLDRAAHVLIGQLTSITPTRNRHIDDEDYAVAGESLYGDWQSMHGETEEYD